jgi:hypothetical protein
VLLLFGLALILNVSTSAAATTSAAKVTTDHTSPTVIGLDPANKSVKLTSQTIKVKFNEQIKLGNKLIYLKNGKTIVSTKKTISGKTLSIIPTKALATGIKYNIILNAGSVTDLSGNKMSSFSSSFTVSPITVAQMKDGISRAQKFYAANGRLPNTVHYGSNLIKIAEFQKIIATQGFKINGVSVNALCKIVGRPVYITSDNINGESTDNSRINQIISNLKSLGITAYNMGLGPNTHITALESSKVPKNALIVDIYGGADAGLIKEMGSSWYASIKGTKKVFTVYWPPSKVITGLSYLVRAHDDNYDPASFKGLAHPDQYMLNLGYNYLYSASITNIASAILYQATH